MGRIHRHRGCTEVVRLCTTDRIGSFISDICRARLLSIGSFVCRSLVRFNLCTFTQCPFDFQHAFRKSCANMIWENRVSSRFDAIIFFLLLCAALEAGFWSRLVWSRYEIWLWNWGNMIARKSCWHSSFYWISQALLYETRAQNLVTRARFSKCK